MNYAQTLSTIYDEVLPLIRKGQVADYIPQLAKVDPGKFGIYLHFLEGESFAMGDAEEQFSIQSISKVLMLCMAVGKLGERVYQRVDVEPSGDPFNSLVQLEYEQGIPRNPFINAGALVITDMLIDAFDDPKQYFLEFARAISGSQGVAYNAGVAKSEKQCGFKNAAIVNLMKSFGNIKNDVEDVLELYYDFCSLEMSCQELAKAFCTIANHGKSIINKKKYLSESQFKRITAIMMTCGFYDEAGEFAFRVGLPGKSGVGGGIVAILPNKFSIAVWSPGLNEKGNSLVGMKVLELFTTKTNLSIF
ncbi:glutaminase [Fulvivirga sp. M361]|uniref:glutaminase n=1 Tax=Fulvivirga sp. M361 TaxID=2594266 RepID=UPI00117B3184|nr:glutaminase [Fulvivirga sp. M361]TRX57711.1 glutaminase [Fulvivirga sp. M361]